HNKYLFCFSVLPCDASPCQNNGTCINSEDVSFTCTCLLGYTGSTCKKIDISFCRNTPVGLEKNDIIPDSRFTASSYYRDRRPEHGRLNNRNHWAAASESGYKYLQIDMIFLYTVCAVATQGTTSSDYNSWTTRYKLSFAVLNEMFSVYREDVFEKMFEGNKDKHTVQKNDLKIPTKARFIEFIPKEWIYWPVLRVEVYGIRLNY
ncbi:lactadherin, partial [Nematostella vectensis]|uniref:lactadherin n=1 Tax=Nematostella vectensis TaxID=45351 RepID=UPI002076F1B4